jgi:hypothetical protein
MMRTLKDLLIGPLTVMLIALAAGCATSPVKRTEQMLTQSGFKLVPAVSVSHQQQMQTLPPNRISAVKRNGKQYYVYPDHARNVLYVGNKAQFHAYQMAIQNQVLTEDSKLIQGVEDSPRVTDDAAIASGGTGAGWGQVWGEWPEDGD